MASGAIINIVSKFTACQNFKKTAEAFGYIVNKIEEDKKLTSIYDRAVAAGRLSKLASIAAASFLIRI